MLNSVLTQIYHLKKEMAVRFSRKNEDVRPFESGGEASLEFFSLKTDCSMFVVSRNPISVKVLFFFFCSFVHFVCFLMVLLRIGFFE